MTNDLIPAMDSNLLYEITDDRAEPLEAPGNAYRHEREPAARWRLSYLDSFDWRLYRKGLLLRFERIGTTPPRSELRLTKRDGSPGQAVPVAGAPAFARNLPQSALRQRLEKILGERRMLVMVKLDLTCVETRMVDDDQKTVARTFRIEGTASEPEGQAARIGPMLELRAVRGYRSAFRDLQANLEAQPGTGLLKRSLFEFALEAVGKEAGGYSSSIAVDLEPAMPVEEATAAMLQSQLDVVEANWKGVRRDLDPEFLHDLRVATRRVRSLLSQFKEVLPSAGFKRLRKDLRWLGKVTGPKRDIDVYLSTLATYDRIFPTDVIAGLQPLKDYLTRRQGDEQALLASALDSGRFRRLISDWRDAIRICGLCNTEVPIAKLAATRIIAVDRKALVTGAEIGDRLDPVRLHGLRIECKKLRYLLEFFHPLFGPRVLQRLISELKRLQDVLGAINDLQVQQQNLQRYAKAMASEDVRQADTLLTMGRLLGHFETSQVKLFPKFQASFRSFSRKAVQAKLPDRLVKYLEDSL